MKIFLLTVFMSCVLANAQAQFSGAVPLKAAAASSAGTSTLRYVPEACCQSLATLTSSQDEHVLQIEEHGTATYLLSQTYGTQGEFPYGMFTKLNDRGQVLWRVRTEQYGQFTSFVKMDEGFLLSGGNYVFEPVQTATGGGSGDGGASGGGSSGSSTAPVPPPRPNRGFIISISEEGDTRWTKQYFTLSFDHLTSVSGTNYAYFLSQQTASQPTYYQVPQVYRVTNDGVVTALTVLSGSASGSNSHDGDYEAQAMFVNERNEIVIFGSIRDQRVVVYHLDQTGNMIKHLAFTGSSHRIEQVAQLSDDRYLLLGFGTDGTDYSARMWIVEDTGPEFSVQLDRRFHDNNLIDRFFRRYRGTRWC